MSGRSSVQLSESNISGSVNVNRAHGRIRGNRISLQSQLPARRRPATNVLSREQRNGLGRDIDCSGGGVQGIDRSLIRGQSNGSVRASANGADQDKVSSGV